MTLPTRLLAAALLLPGLSAAALPAALDMPAARQADDDPVTSEGFAQLAYETTFYIEVPLVGTFGQDVWADAVTQTIRSAAANPHVQHAVFLLDSETEEGAMFSDEVVGIRQDSLEIHGVVHNATLLSTAPVFFCDSLFIVEGGHIGGLPLHNYIPPGSEEVTAKQVGIFTNQLASAAEVHGHNPDIVRALINKEESLHYWRERGVVYVSNTPPADTGSVDDYQHVTPLVTGETITLDYDQVIKFELALPIEEFDAEWVGEKIGAPGWLPANRYGLVAGQIGFVTSGLQPLMTRLDELDKLIPAVQIDRDNRNNRRLRMQNEIKRTLERGVSIVEQINNQLEDLYTAHPERHAYFAGANGQTILEDPAQWEIDCRQARSLVGQTRSRLSQLQSVIEQLDMAKALYNSPEAFFDPAEVAPYLKMLDEIDEHLDGILRHGNAHYWDRIYVEPLPEDEYGVTYG